MIAPSVPLSRQIPATTRSTATTKTTTTDCLLSAGDVVSVRIRRRGSRHRLLSLNSSSACRSSTTSSSSQQQQQQETKPLVSLFVAIVVFFFAHTQIAPVYSMTSNPHLMTTTRGDDAEHHTSGYC
mmetsp:Transcript_69083/g.77278  ORF Transcript_69083/g.77278 Transcript_69083/m.77278 type:complete len:126 (-) Transcript_69083:291-668(-)